MRRIAGVLFVFMIFTLAPASAQSPQYRRPASAQEECPQGRQIRAQKSYPASMTDCEVLDRDTQQLNQARTNARQSSPPPAPASADPSPKKSSKPNWVSVEAENGAVTKVDMNSIQRGDGAAIIFTYADEGRPEDAYKLQGYMFDCQGHYELMGLQSSPSLYAPPRSVAARISELACSAPVGTVPQ
jgi:hypothetical protein